MKTIITLLGLLSISLSVFAGGKKECQVVLNSTLADGTVVSAPFDSSKSWGEQLVGLRLDAIEDFNHRTSKLTSDERLKLIISEDFRKFFFQLESLARVYEQLDEKFFGPLGVEFKAIEDKMGYMDLQRTLKEKAIELKSPELEKYFGDRQAVAGEKLLQALESWNDTKTESLRAKFKKYSEWLEGNDDRNFLFDKIHDELKALQKDVEANQFDQPDIEEGLHELRRRIRWVVIQVLTLNHVVKYTKETELSSGVSQWFQELLAKDPALLNNKYMKIDEAAIQNPIIIPLQMEGIVTKIVSNIGSLKDGSEMQIEFTKAMKALNFSGNKIKVVITALNTNLGIQPIDHQELAREYMRKLIESDLLKKFAKAIKKMN